MKKREVKANKKGPRQSVKIIEDVTYTEEDLRKEIESIVNLD